MGASRPLPANHPLIHANTETTMKITVDPIPDANDFFTLRPSDGSPHGDTDAQPIATVFDDSNAQIIAAAVTACHNLDLPANVAPGALAEIVTAARNAVSSAGDEALGIYFLRKLEAALTKLDPPKPYAYAVKTAEGYVANQGNQWWHESEPVGWALFGDRKWAETIAGVRGGKVAPVFKR